MRTQRRTRGGLSVLECRSCRLVFVNNPPTVTGSEDEEMPYDEYDAARRGDAELRGKVLERLSAIAPVGPDGRVRLFDVGAGTGEFLDKARTHGFAISGSDFSPQSVAYCASQYGVELNTLTLDQQQPGSVDVVTMWCVLAHVPDTTAFLSAAYRMLRPGGILFLRTPRRCGIDYLGRVAEVCSGGRFDQVSERRVNVLHRQLYSETGLGRQLRTVGLTEIDMQAKAHYFFTTATYAHGSVGTRSRGTVRLAAPAIDRLIRREWIFRNALLVYARRPFES